MFDNNKLIKLLECPDDFESIDQNIDRCNHIGFVDWYYSLIHFAVSGDEKMIITDHADDDLMNYINEFSDVENIYMNILDKHSEALVFYKTLSGRIFNLKYLEPHVHKKHFIKAGREIVIERSKVGVSYLFQNFQEKQIKQMFWDWARIYFEPLVSDVRLIDAYFEKFKEGIEIDADLSDRLDFWRDLCFCKKNRIALELDTEVGASKGHATKFICFNVGVTDVHIYPVSQSEAVDIMKPLEVAFLG